MKKTALLTLCALPFVFSHAQANGLTTEPAVAAYWDIPLGATRTGRAPQAFGVRMDQVVRDNQASPYGIATRAPVVDFRFNSEGMQGIYVRGINMTTPAIMKLGILGFADPVVGWIVLGAAVGATALVVEANNHGGSSTASSCAPTVGLNAVCDRFSSHGLGVACCD